MAYALRAAVRGEVCAISRAADGVLDLAGPTALWNGGRRLMAVQVEVKDNRVHQALSDLNRKRDDEGLTGELRKRQFYMNGSERRYEMNKRSYKHAVGEVVSERVKWVMQRRPGR